MMTRLLLDTCALIWIVENDAMSPSSVAAINSAVAGGDTIAVSPISAWERGMLVSKGRVASLVPPQVWFQNLLSRPEVSLVPLSIDVLTQSSFLPGDIHGDPADRIIVATARTHDLTIVTRDRAILTYARQGHVRVLPC